MLNRTIRRAASATMMLAAAMFSAAPLRSEPAPKQTLKIGMIGLDTSHCIAFTELLNVEASPQHVPGGRVTLVHPQGSPDIASSVARVPDYTKKITALGVELVDAGKPLFIDKPAAGTLADAIAIFDLAARNKVPCFSSSSVRFGAGLQELRKNPSLGAIAGASTWGPCSYQEGTPDLFFYGIHGVEALYTLMGTGCETVSRVQADDADLVTGVWKNGRVGTYRGLRRNKAEFGAVAFGAKAIVPMTKGDGYEPLCREIGKFFRSGVAPVPAAETIEVLAFMEAADESKRQGGKPVSLADVMAKARAAAPKAD